MGHDINSIAGSTFNKFLRGVHLHNNNNIYQVSINAGNPKEGQIILDSFMPTNVDHTREQRRDERNN
jgi:hypothetical protein